MFYGIISDIHSNLPALSRVLEELKALHVDAVLCLGDIVGYAAQPRECIEATRQRAQAVVLGNHDAGAVGITPLDYFNALAKEALLWTQKVLSPEEHAYLRSLPLTHECEDFLLVHGSPAFPEEWRYIFAEEHAREGLRATSHRLVFVGHTHCPEAFSMGQDGVKAHHPGTMVLEEGRRYLVNPGSVGQPRDGDARASFVTYKSDQREIEFHRVTYDIGKAQHGIIAAGIPPELALRLSMGF
jgi:diadenosine tetraphosphatase ApaH/serine/threonine PP2A family protein phosphatase